MLITTFSAYDALGNLLEKRKRKIISQFAYEGPEYSVGIWVSNEGKYREFSNEASVVPLYLTEEQIQEAKENLEGIDDYELQK